MAIRRSRTGPARLQSWSGRTDDQGIAIAPRMRLRDPAPWWDRQLRFVVTAAKDGDIAYVGSDWNEGIEPFAFGARSACAVIVGSNV